MIFDRQEVEDCVQGSIKEGDAINCREGDWYWRKVYWKKHKNWEKEQVEKCGNEGGVKLLRTLKRYKTDTVCLCLQALISLLTASVHSPL